MKAHDEDKNRFKIIVLDVKIFIMGENIEMIITLI